ncbi:uncharacterized protein PSFLO_07407 [Pseudozyma flocculosa]|uniref:Uncharacterized protein n=1 Tax=Pseudozyma flocculosa TaxID=84751 RepID=A0A5C3FBV3_9BASI|nr:uncharacterized protein PSFLO_07407 [Pseudozyma flocculosa]
MQVGRWSGLAWPGLASFPTLGSGPARVPRFFPPGRADPAYEALLAPAATSSASSPHGRSSERPGHGIDKLSSTHTPVDAEDDDDKMRRKDGDIFRDDENKQDGPRAGGP